ncbi:hypothetical protein [Enterococcus sp. AZ109]|uniref:hypothetical protein n=1 Tax=Enterococcus sp. AZ109 TaxID=2774634 RepID=UPI003F1FB325
MNLIRQYEFGIITIEELINELWNFGPNAINEVDENCFQFYIDRACGYHELDYYVEERSNGIKNRNCK